MDHNPPAIIEDYHQPWKSQPQLIQLCGGGSSEDGMMWSWQGTYYQFPGEDSKALEDKYGSWWPSINPETMVRMGSGIKIPGPGFKLAPGAMEEYHRLLKISRIKYVHLPGAYTDGNYIEAATMVTREFIN